MNNRVNFVRTIIHLGSYRLSNWFEACCAEVYYKLAKPQSWVVHGIVFGWLSKQKSELGNWGNNEECCVLVWSAEPKYFSLFDVIDSQLGIIVAIYS